MRNYLVPPGTVVRTPEIARLSDGHIIRVSQVLVSGPAETARKWKQNLFTAVSRFSFLHLLTAIICFLIYGLKVKALLMFGTVALIGFGMSVGLYHTCFTLGKRGLEKYCKDICPVENEFRAASLEKGSKASQPSLLHRYHLMRYNLTSPGVHATDGLEIAVHIDPSRQRYWSLVFYDLYGLPLSAYVNDENARKTPCKDPSGAPRSHNSANIII